MINFVIIQHNIFVVLYKIISFGDKLNFVFMNEHSELYKLITRSAGCATQKKLNDNNPKLQHKWKSPRECRIKF